MPERDLAEAGAGSHRSAGRQIEVQRACAPGLSSLSGAQHGEQHQLNERDRPVEVEARKRLEDPFFYVAAELHEKYGATGGEEEVVARNKYLHDQNKMRKQNKKPSEAWGYDEVFFEVFLII